QALLFFTVVVFSFTTAAPFEEIPGDLIPVPGRGWQPKSQVHLIPDGGRVVAVSDEMHLLGASGKVLHVAHNVSSTRNISLRDDAVSGWIMTAVWYVGQVLTGVMTQTKQSLTSYSLTAAFTGIAGTTLSGTYITPLTDTYASALETYGTKTHSMDYPAGTLTFSNIALKFAGTAPAVAYTVLDYQPSIGMTSITTNGARGTKTVIHEPPVFQLMKFCTDAPFLNSIASTRIILSGADYACYLYRCGTDLAE
ncbi:hypothetical protein B0H13DRAFT_2163408, partial [Mycena leptocephala]